MDLKDTVLRALNELVKNGGEGSGDFGHAGNPPHVGGSEPVGSRHARGFKSKSERKEVKKEENKDKLDIKKTTVTTKAGKKREIEYVESVPDGFKELKGATTAPLGYTWYTNGKSILDKSRKNILVKDKANNSIYKHEYIEY